MEFFPLFALRVKTLPEIYAYDKKLPFDLRDKLCRLMLEATGRWITGTVAEERGKNVTNTNNRALFNLYHPIYNKLEKEFGGYRQNYFHNAQHKVVDFFRFEKRIERSLTVLELVFEKINTVCRTDDYREKVKSSIEVGPDEAISELNFRLRENGIGYQFADNQIIKLNATVSHGEMIVPALRLLAHKKFRGANAEFMSAHAHYRNQKYKECLLDCCKAFESTIKIICDAKGWPYGSTDPAKKLIKVIIDNQLLPTFISSQFDSFENLIGSGVTTIRNKMAGHGQGSSLIVVPEEVAKYALNLTASNILFIVESAKIT